MTSNNTNKNTAGMDMKVAGMDIKVLLSTVWLFSLLNYAYCDIISLFNVVWLNKTTPPFQITEGFLLATAILLEIPIAMILLSRVLKYRANRWANIITGTIMTVEQFSTLFIGTTPALYYIFFSIIEILSTALIVWLAWKWKPVVAPNIS